MMKFTHIRLLVNNFKDCFRFYKDVLGFNCSWGDENSGYADFELGNIKIALFDRKSMAEAVGTKDKSPQTEAQDSHCLIFAVENVDKTYIKLTEKGIVFVSKPKNYQGWGIRAAHFRDPAGNLIEINQDL